MGTFPPQPPPHKTVIHAAKRANIQRHHVKNHFATCNSNTKPSDQSHERTMPPLQMPKPPHTAPTCSLFSSSQPSCIQWKFTCAKISDITWKEKNVIINYGGWVKLLLITKMNFDSIPVARWQSVRDFDLNSAILRGNWKFVRRNILKFSRLQKKGSTLDMVLQLMKYLVREW